MSKSNLIEEIVIEGSDVSPEAKALMYGIFDELMVASQDPENHPAFAQMRAEFKKEAERKKQK